MTPGQARLRALIIAERQKARTARIRVALAVDALAPEDAELVAAIEAEAAATLKVSAALRTLWDRLRGAPGGR